MKVRRGTVLKHDGEELDDDLRARPDEDLTLAPLLGIADALEAVVQNTDAHHFQGYYGSGDMVR